MTEQPVATDVSAMFQQYPLAKNLLSNPARHCASLAIVENWPQDQRGRMTIAQPSECFRNGTMTFVEFEGRVFGITCWHVIEHFRSQESIHGEGRISLRTMNDGFHIILDRFIRPSPQYGCSDLDIAIREVAKEFPQAIGKTPISINASNFFPDEIRHGYAVGFPESLKLKRDEKNRNHYRISMPQVQILAEIERTPADRFTMFSELPTAPDFSDFSGMSGGPIYWSTESDYGLLGIIYEGGVLQSPESSNPIAVYGELATPQIIQTWIAEVTSSK